MNWSFMCKRLIIKGCPIFGIGQTSMCLDSVFGRLILCVCVCVRREPGNEASIQL